MKIAFDRGVEGFEAPAAAARVDCIDCHMPALPSAVITFGVNGKDKPMPDLIRTHRVAVYPDIAQQYLQKGKF